MQRVPANQSQLLWKSKLNDSTLAFYFDESVQVAIADQLIRNGIDCVTVRDLEKLSDADPNHLKRATDQKRVLVTYDDDFVEMAHKGAQHAGIVFVPNRHRRIGIVVKELRKFQVQYEQQQVKNQVWFLTSS